MSDLEDRTRPATGSQNDQLFGVRLQGLIVHVLTKPFSRPSSNKDYYKDSMYIIHC